MRQLLTDVQSGDAPFKVILVYDVSRWGRFQNTDQAAYYDYLCSMHGIEVIYVAEQFLNDGSPFAAILKNLKRAMAAEYSRELSIKCKAGQMRLARLGFAMGGTTLFGMRRLVVTHLGEPRVVLGLGERKAIQSDHVVLIPGPAKEVALVRRIFRLYASTDVNIADIVDILKREGKKTHHGADFCRAGLRRMLCSEAYIGNNVWAKNSLYLGAPSTPNPPEKWARKNECYEPIINTRVFAKVQKRLAVILNRVLTREQLLEDMRTTLAVEGYLTPRIIAQRGGANRDAYKNEFGNMTEAYRLVGYVPDLRHAFALAVATRKFTNSVTAALATKISASASTVKVSKKECKITVDGQW